MKENKGEVDAVRCNEGLHIQPSTATINGPAEFTEYTEFTAHRHDRLSNSHTSTLHRMK